MFVRLKETFDVLVNNTSNERRSRRHHHHHKKRRSSSSGNERNSSSPQSSSAIGSKTTRGTQLIVNYLPSSLRESDFYQLFARVAPIKLCKLITDRHTGHSFCYGFIEYHSKDDALKAIEKYNGYKIEHKKLKVSYAQPKLNNNPNDIIDNDKSMTGSQKNPNIYITDLPDTFDEKMLERLFSKYGEIVKTKVLRDPRTKISRGVAFVLMTSTRYAERAVKALDGYIPSGLRTPISVKYADPSKTTNNNGNNHSSSRLPSSTSMPPSIGPYGYPPALAPLSMIDPYYAAAALHHHHHHHRAAMNMYVVISLTFIHDRRAFCCSIDHCIACLVSGEN
jgi:RNA recognition motif-containing protein